MRSFHLRKVSTPRFVTISLLLVGCSMNESRASHTMGSSNEEAGLQVSVTGVWQGTMSYLDASLPIGFTLVEDGGVISGKETVYDPVSNAIAATIPLSGTDDGGNAQWSTLGHGFVVAGSLAGETFEGSITMPALDGGALQASLALSRADGGAP